MSYKKMNSKRTSHKYCKICQFAVRGKNHNNGQHHKKAVRKFIPVLTKTYTE